MTTIRYEDLKSLPSRISYINQTEHLIIKDTLQKKQPVEFLPTYLKELNVSDNMQPGKYKILLYGIFKDGSSATVLLDGIEPYFEIRVPQSEDVDVFEKALKKKLVNLSIRPESIQRVISKPFKYYQKRNSTFIRLYYNKIKDRKNALYKILDAGYETATDDMNNYYRVACRNDLLSFSTWSEISNYLVETIDGLSSMAANLRVSYTNYKALSDDRITMDMRKEKTVSCCWDLETWNPSGEVPLPDQPEANIICAGMTFQFVNDKVPFKKICLVDYPSDNKLANVELDSKTETKTDSKTETKTETKTEISPECESVTIICRTEENIIKGFADIICKMQPEFIFGFNDGEYDWNWIIQRAKKYKLLAYLEERLNRYRPSWYQDSTNAVKIEKSYCKKIQVKIGPDVNVEPLAFSADGYYALDVRVLFRKLFPNAEQSSLKYFLEECKLSGKDHMPIKVLHKTYSDYRSFAIEKKFCSNGVELEIQPHELEQYLRLKSQLADVNKYCVVDAQRCHDLVKARNVITDAREIGNMAYVSIFDAFFRANGVKIRNLAIAIGQKAPFNYRFSNIGQKHCEEGKYPGAYVYPPKKGLKVTKLSVSERIKKANDTANDKQPLMREWLNETPEQVKQYNNFIEKYGPDYIETITDELTNECAKDEINECAKDELKKFPKHFQDFIKEQNGRPITGLDFSSLYPSLIRTYNFSPEYCVMSEKFAKELHAEGYQLTKVKFDFNSRTRKAYFISHEGHTDPTDPKFRFGVLAYILDGIFKKRKEIKKILHKYEMQLEELERDGKADLEEYSNIQFLYDCVDSKQKALKVFMNTFYGECGSKISPFFILELAGGITTYGVKNIKFALNYVTDHGCRVYYCDTDSIYLSIPERYFTQVDKLFYTNKISKKEYWTKLVEITFDQINAIQTDVNKQFELQTKTSFLQMAYEEVLFPSNFMAKKKYYGIPHKKIVNFNSKLFIRGVSVKCKGVSAMLRNIFTDLMKTTMSVDNLYTVMELVTRKIDYIYNTKWGPELFTQTDVYKPNKQNVKVHTFVNRMAERGIIIPPHERYSYVLVKRYPFMYDHRGRKKALTAGHKVELVETMQKENLQIDLDYYMKGSINGLFARFITYHPDFQIVMNDINDQEELKLNDKKVYANAVKYVGNYCEKYYTYYDSYGKVLQETFKIVNKSAKLVIDKAVHKTGINTGAGDSVGELLTCNVDLDEFEKWVIESTKKKADKHVAKMKYGEFIIEKILSREVTGLERVEAKKKRKGVVIDLQRAYYADGGKKQFRTLRSIRQEMHDRTIHNLRVELSNHIDEYKKLFSDYHGKLNIIISQLKIDLGIDWDLGSQGIKDESETAIQEKTKLTLEHFGTINDEKLEIAVSKATSDMMSERYKRVLKEFRKLYNWFIVEYAYNAKNESIIDYLKVLGSKYTNVRDISDKDKQELLNQMDFNIEL